MGRKGSVPAGEGFLPGTSAGELARLARKETDGKTARKYLAAYHRKEGKSFSEIAEITLDTYVAVRNWLVAMHNGGRPCEPLPRRDHAGWANRGQDGLSERTFSSGGISHVGR